MVRHCARGRPPLSSPSPTLRTAARDTGPQRRGLFSGAARTLPGSGRRANDILYIRVRRREGENVLHRAAGNDVDNFSVDNALWITAAAGGRLLRGGRGRLCGESVNADAEVQTRTGRVRKTSRAMGARRGRLSAPWLRFHGADRADVYIIIRVRATCCGKCALNSPTAQPIPRRRPPLAHAQRHALAEHFHSPTQRRRALPEHFRLPHAAPMHARGLHDAFLADLTTPFPAKALRPPRTATRPRRALPLPHAAPTHARRLRDAFPADRTTHSPPKTFAHPRTATRPPRAFPLPHAAPTHARRPHNPFPAEDLRPPPHSNTPSPNTSTPPRSADTRPQAARCIPRRPHNPFLAEDLLPPPHSDTPTPSTSTPPRSADARPPTAQCIPAGPHNPFPVAPPCPLLRSASGTKKRHRTMHVRCRMSRSTVVAVGHLGW